MTSASHAATDRRRGSIMLQSGHARRPWASRCSGTGLGDDRPKVGLDVRGGVLAAGSHRVKPAHHRAPTASSASRTSRSTSTARRIARLRPACAGSVQDVIEVADRREGPSRMTVEGRERYPVRVRYLRELRGDVELHWRGSSCQPLGGDSDAAGPVGGDPLQVRGPQVIKSEDTFAHRLRDLRQGCPTAAEVDVVERLSAPSCEEQIATGEHPPPGRGCSYSLRGELREPGPRAPKTAQGCPATRVVLDFLAALPAVPLRVDHPDRVVRRGRRLGAEASSCSGSTRSRGSSTSRCSGPRCATSSRSDPGTSAWPCGWDSWRSSGSPPTTAS